jgi:hypothetical protein
VAKVAIGCSTSESILSRRTRSSHLGSSDLGLPRSEIYSTPVDTIAITVNAYKYSIFSLIAPQSLFLKKPSVPPYFLHCAFASTYRAIKSTEARETLPPNYTISNTIDLVGVAELY